MPQVSRKQRNMFAVELYYTVYRRRMKETNDHNIASGDAYYAVELRYGISDRTLQNIIYRDPSLLKGAGTAFRETARQLVTILRKAVAEREEANSRDMEMLRIMEEALGDDR